MSFRQVRILLFGVLITLLGIIISVTPFGRGLESRFGLDNLFRLRGEIPSANNAIVVAINRDTVDALGNPTQLDRWSRSHHAQLIGRLTELGAEAIVFDILFAEQRNSADDNALATAMRQANNVAIIYMLGNERLQVNNQLEKQVSTVSLEQRMYPLEIFSDAALVTAPFVLPKVPAQVRQYWTFKSQSSSSLPVIALEIYSLQDYAAWKSLWQAVDPDFASRFPDTADNQENRRQVLALGAAVRERLRSHASLTERLLETTARSEWPPQTQRRLSALIQVYAGDDSRVLNFYGGPGAIKNLAYHSIIDNSLTPLEATNVAGKVIFVGFSERRVQAQRDGFLTVFSRENGQDLAGVEIAATAFSNLLYGEDIKPLTPLHYWGLLVLWGLLIGILSRMMGTVWSLVILLSLSLAYFAAVFYLFAEHNLWLPLVVPLFFQAPAAFFLALAIRYLDSSAESHRLKKAFSYYVPPEVVLRYSDNDTALETEGRLVHGICLFSDAQQYTRLAEQLSPPALAQLVNDYYAILFAPVRNEGGIISDVVGDAMLALWVDQKERDLQASKACTAALTISHETSRAAGKGKASALPTRIGLHGGLIQLGNVGAGNHYEYRAVGDTVNTATRIEGLNKLLGTRLLVTDSIAHNVHDRLFRPVGHFVLAGKSQALGVHELLSTELNASICNDVYLNRYREGLLFFKRGEWQDAFRIFSELQREHPEDGPARYYRMLSESFLPQPPANWDGVIRLASK